MKSQHNWYFSLFCYIYQLKEIMKTIKQQFKEEIIDTDMTNVDDFCDWLIINKIQEMILTRLENYEEAGVLNKKIKYFVKYEAEVLYQHNQRYTLKSIKELLTRHLQHIHSELYNHIDML